MASDTLCASDRGRDQYTVHDRPAFNLTRTLGKNLLLVLDVVNKPGEATSQTPKDRYLQSTSIKQMRL